jgi:hypothetical protein
MIAAVLAALYIQALYYHGIKKISLFMLYAAFPRGAASGSGGC